VIRFGTSGWRGILAEDFTFSAVRAVARAIADHLLIPGSRAPGPGPSDPGLGTRDSGLAVVVGYDTRFQSETFGAECAGVLAAAGIRCHLTGRPTPTPVLAHAVRALGAAGAINITAGHNPPEWNGLKFSGAAGGPALPAAADAIAQRANAILADPASAVPTLPLAEAQGRGLVRALDPAPAYCAQLRRLVDFAAIRPAGMRVGVDLLHGTAGGYLDALLRDAGCEVHALHAERGPGFGGHPPEPAAGCLAALAAAVRGEGCHVGLACDGDADRFGILDADGAFLEPNAVLALAVA
jgi:phosphomannomutase